MWLQATACNCGYQKEYVTCSASSQGLMVVFFMTSGDARTKVFYHLDCARPPGHLFLTVQCHCGEYDGFHNSLIL